VRIASSPGLTQAEDAFVLSLGRVLRRGWGIIRPSKESSPPRPSILQSLISRIEHARADTRTVVITIKIYVPASVSFRETEREEREREREREREEGERAK